MGPDTQLCLRQERRATSVSVIILFSEYPADSPSELHILWHNRDTFGVDSTEISVFEEMNKMGLSRLLQRKERVSLPPELLIRKLELHFPHQSREWQLPEQQLGRLLVFAYLPDGLNAWSIPLL